MLSRFARLVLQCSICVAAAACNTANNAIPCTMNDQCQSHFCQPDDTCAPVESIDGGGETDGPVGGTDGGGSAAGCTPNHDGTIEAAELPLAAGASAPYLVAQNPTWDTTGSADAVNNRSWDLSGALTGDNRQTIALTSPAGTWWGSDFPTATYATILSVSQPDLLGVFHVDPTGVTLIGVVSTSAGSTKTELTYTPAAQILAVPFSAGSTWTSTSTVTGTYSGVAGYYYDETYASEVDEVGTMVTPYGSFPTLRVATNFSKDNVPFSRTFAWVAECFGSVAQAQSQTSATPPYTVPTGEFSNPAEVWRITH